MLARSCCPGLPFDDGATIDRSGLANGATTLRSETVKKTGAVGVNLKEAQHINKSLSALSEVINKLSSRGKA